MQTSPITAHQQKFVPLLRRPRPPKQVKTIPLISNTSRKTTPKRGTGMELSAIASNTLDSAFAHPTPLSTVMTPYTQYTYTTEYTDTCDDTGSTFTIYPLYPRGPSFLPPGKVLRGTHVPGPGGRVFDDGFQPQSELQTDQAEFALKDFQLSAETLHQTMPSKLQGAMISRQNYLKLTSWFAANIPKQEAINTVDLKVDHQAPEERKPMYQMLLEMQAMIQEVLDVSGLGCSEESTATQSSVSLEAPSWPTPSANDIVFRSSTSRYFCGQGRSNSPFDARHQPLISPAEVAVLESMMEGGRQLSLKAHFLPHLPDLASLSTTLTHLNVSFNDLRVFPSEVLQLHELVCLKMRNNPVKEIPNDIRKLVKLETLCTSFNLLADLPSGLFDLAQLVELDVSHNSLQWLSRDISKLRNLRRLNIEGNQLAGLPSTALSLPLTHLLPGDNYMHPLLWRENTRNQPQTLVDLCCVAIESIDDFRLPTDIRQTLQSCQHGVCDFCSGPVFGTGLRLIRAVANEKFKVKNLPFIFTLCCPTCRDFFLEEVCHFTMCSRMQYSTEKVWAGYYELVYRKPHVHWMVPLSWIHGIFTLPLINYLHIVDGILELVGPKEQNNNLK